MYYPLVWFYSLNSIYFNFNCVKYNFKWISFQLKEAYPGPDSNPRRNIVIWSLVPYRWTTEYLLRMSKFRYNISDVDSLVTLQDYFMYPTHFMFCNRQNGDFCSEYKNFFCKVGNFCDITKIFFVYLQIFFLSVVNYV